MKWKPIETAPKDGTWILICYEGYGALHAAHPVSARWATFHPNAPGKLAWRNPVGVKVGGTHWAAMPKGPPYKSKEKS